MMCQLKMKRRTFGQKLFQCFGSFLINLIDRALDLPDHPSYSRCRFPSNTLSISTCNLLENLDKSCLFANRVAVKLGHVWATTVRQRLELSLGARQLLCCSPFHIAQEPPLSEVLDHSDDEDELVPTDERQSEITGPVHHVWIIQISSARVSTRPAHHRDRYHLPIYSRVFEISWKIFDEEIAVKPSLKTASTSAEKTDHDVGGKYRRLQGLPNSP